MGPARAEYFSWQLLVRTGLSDTAIQWLIGCLLVGLPLFLGLATAYLLGRRHPGYRSMMGLSAFLALLVWWFVLFGLGNSLPVEALLPVMLLSTVGAAASVY